MKEEYESNYVKVIEHWREKFLQMEHEKLIEKFHLKADDSCLYLTYYSRELSIDREDGKVRLVQEPERELTFNTVVTVYNMFHYAAEHPVASGELIPFRKVKRVYPFEQAYRRTILQKLENTFTGQVERLRRACEALQGIPMRQGDAGYILPVFPFLNIAVLFWDADEEFSAQANMLFDSNITDFMHEENVVGVASDAVFYLMEAAGMKAEILYGE